MHFWIDKRSQQCGFGRSRVAASLSHAGSGLSYGHPPRRTKSTSCSNSTGQSMPPVHRSLPQTPYDMHQPGTSRQSQSQSSYGNNNSLHAQQQQHSSSGGTSNNNNLTATGTTTTASNNNHASGIASSAAVLTGSGTIVPLVARGSHYNHHGNTRYQPRAQQQLLHQHQQQPHLHQQQQHQHQQQQHYSYHHPQFGNMAVPVRHFDAHQQQQQQQQYSGNVYADDAYSVYHHTAHHQHSSNHSTSGSNNQRQATAYATPRRHNSSNNMRHSTPAAATAATTTAADTASVASPAAAVAAAPATMHSNQLQQQHHHALLQHADSQLLPSHLKCGMCASLVLASVFVAGTKFYFDHQGTGLEVLIFCVFSAFFLAACLISLCRIPKGLFSNSSRSNGRAAVCHTRGVNSSLAGAGAAQSAGCLLEMSEGRYLEERQVTTVGGTAATAGPPPYHIAILLPEQTPATMGKQLPLDESPPPSYDKILV
ncbi:GATA zinc finger domain-containing protein 10 [Drosophila santomea]|uniref:GATA zinc finger domain-containing protein 10 n=1 Tax=Drosophila santomea TaxID=129105 RepID=UPI00195456E5|nr:GATA zinc finger domain-containing protein 10 [Drosophila santomea]